MDKSHGTLGQARSKLDLLIRAFWHTMNRLGSETCPGVMGGRGASLRLQWRASTLAAQHPPGRGPFMRFEFVAACSSPPVSVCCRRFCSRALALPCPTLLAYRKARVARLPPEEMVFVRSLKHPGVA